MPEDLRDPEKRQAEMVMVSKILLRQAVEKAGHELDFLILSTPSGPERNKLTEMNIHLEQIRKRLPE